MTKVVTPEGEYTVNNGKVYFCGDITCGATLPVDILYPENRARAYSILQESLREN